jgi:hypothetical protein
LQVGGVISDVLLHTLPVAGSQDPVFIATSFSVSASTPATEGFSAPSEEPFSGTLSVAAGVGRLPALTLFGNDTIHQIRDPWARNGYSLLTALVCQ